MPEPKDLEITEVGVLTGVNMDQLGSLMLYTMDSASLSHQKLGHSGRGWAGLLRPLRMMSFSVQLILTILTED